MTTPIMLAGREIGPAFPPFTIAEVGINHNGDLATACRMIEVARQAGADAVKFQTFTASEFCGDPAQMFTYQSQGRTVTEPMLEMFRRHEFSRAQWQALKACCDKAGIAFLSTPQNPSDLELLLELGISAVKIGSDDFSNVALIRRYAASGLPLILSCGMSDIAEVHQALDAARWYEGHPLVLLLCTSQYPTPPQDVNIRKLQTLQHSFPGLTVGFSDHTQGSVAASLAVAHGACVLEKHFTLSHDLPGPDHWFSEEPDGLAHWVATIQRSHQMLGSPLVRPTAAELDMRILARRSIVVLQDIAAGEVLGAHNVGLRRPGNGLAPALYEQTLGLVASRDLSAGQCLALGDMQQPAPQETA